jgi:hypothetical protein
MAMSNCLRESSRADSTFLKEILHNTYTLNMMHNYTNEINVL